MFSNPRIVFYSCNSGSVVVCNSVVMISHGIIGLMTEVGSKTSIRGYIYESDFKEIMDWMILDDI